MSQDDLYINGELLRLGREARGWVLSDMATRACMSVKQIRQLEEGGTSAFYSPAVKMTSAKKLAGILELSPDQVFNRTVVVEPETVAAPAEEVIKQAEDQPALAEAVVHTPPVSSVEMPASDDVPAGPAVVDQPKAKTSLWAIIALFVAALGVAAFFQQQEEPATEPPPPLQVVPTEADASASAADAASAEADHTVAPAASSAVPSASTAAPVVAPAAPKPAASAASKPL